MTHHTVPIIGIHRSPLSQKFGTPRQPNLVNLHTHIDLLSPYDTFDAFDGISHYSHLWIIWQFHQNKPQAHFRPQVRPPRLGGNDKMGVFATRSMYRPSNLGLSVVQFSHLSQQGKSLSLHIFGADMIDGTPIVDIKPYLPYADSLPCAKNPMAKPTIKAVKISPTAKKSIDEQIKAGNLSLIDIAHIKELIAQDPRPAYHQGRIDKPFIMRYGSFDVQFLMSEEFDFVITNVYPVAQCVKISQQVL